MADNGDYEVDHIREKRIIDGEIHYLIRWKGFDSDWDTWEPVDNLTDCFQLVLDFEEGKRKQASKLLDAVIDAVSKGKSARSPSKITYNKDGKEKSISPSKIHVHTPRGSEKMKGIHFKIHDESPHKQKKQTKDRNQKCNKENKISDKHEKVNRDKKMENNTKSEGEKKKKLKLSPTKTSPQNSPPKKSSPSSSPKKNDNPNSSPKQTGGPDVQRVSSVKLSERDSNSKSPQKKSPSPRKETTQKSNTEKNVQQNISNVSPKQSVKGLKVKSSGESVGGLKVKTSSDSQSSAKRTEESSSVKKKVESKNKNSIDNYGKYKKEKKGKSSVGFALKVKYKPNKKAFKPNGELKLKHEKNKKKEIEPKIQKNAEKKGPEKYNQVNKKNKDKNMPSKSKKNVMNKEKSAQKRKTDVVSIIECSDSDDEPLSHIKVKKKQHSPKQTKEVKKMSPKVKPDQDPKNVTKNKLTIENVKRKLEVKVHPLGSPSKAKKMRLLDSIKDREMVQVALPVSPTTSFTTVKPMSATGVSMVNQLMDSGSSTPLCGDVPAYQYIPSVIPISPSSMSYKALLDNIPLSMIAKKTATKKREEDSQDEVERRISVRQSECAYRYKEIVVRKCQRYTQIWLNTHTKIKNSLNPQVIQEVIQAMNSAKYDDSNLVLFSGLGNVFCNGVDLKFLTSGEKRMVVRQMVDAVRDFTKALITFPKPVIAVVTGPAVGLGMAMLPLCDIVYASDKATFYLPYSLLSQTPEGCASYTLPQSVGMAMANELLLAGRKITAIEACQLGLVSQVFWPTSMMQEVIPKVQNIALHSAKALETTKLLLRSHQRTKLELTCETEGNILLERWQSTDCQKAMEIFLNNEESFSI